MKFTKYTKTRGFADDTFDVLKKHEIQNNHFFKNVDIGIEKEKERDLNDDVILATVKADNGDILLTVSRTVPNPFIIFATDNIINDDALEFLAASLAENNIYIDIVSAGKELVKKFCDLYGKHIDKSFYCHENLVLYLLEKVNDLPQIDRIDGVFRNANENDMLYLPYWLADFVVACHIGEYNLDGGIEMAKRQINNGTAYIFEDKIPVSVAASARRTSNCAFVGPVYTPPVFRGKGYSTACVAKLSQKLFDEGWKYCALYADCANPYSNRVYQKIGYREIFYADQYRIKK